MEKQTIENYESEVMFEGNSVYRGVCPKCSDSIVVANDFVPNYDYSQDCSCGLTWSVSVEVRFEGEKRDW